MHRLAMTLLTCTTLLAAGAAHAQGRGEPATRLREHAVKAEDTPEARSAELAELEAFLRYLVDRFRLEGEVKRIWGITGSVTPGQGCDGEACYVVKTAEGVADGVGFGDGPGVQCATHVPWPRFFRPI